MLGAFQRAVRVACGGGVSPHVAHTPHSTVLSPLPPLRRRWVARRRVMRGGLVAVLVAALWPAGPVAADAAGPTDYRSVITEVDVDGVTTAVSSPTDGATSHAVQIVPGALISVEGHDSFLWLRVELRMTAAVPGYEGEAYLRIDADGSVWRNQRSFSTYYNQDRYGDAARPAIVDHSAEPLWEQVDDDGSWAWHDHRIHLMDTQPPIGASPGDPVVTAVVPMTIDDQQVRVRVVATLLDGAALWPTVLAALIAGGVAAGVVVGGRRRWGNDRHPPGGVDDAALRTGVVVAGGAAVVSLVAGVGWCLYSPTDTGPLLTWWALPTTAVLAVVVAVWARPRSLFLAASATLIAGAEVLIWVLGRTDVVSAALIPTVLPHTVDRVLTALAAVWAVVAVGLSGWAVVRPVIRAPYRAPQR